MDPDAIRPAFLGVFRATIAFARVAPMTTARTSSPRRRRWRRLNSRERPDSLRAAPRESPPRLGGTRRRARRARPRSLGSRSRTSANSTRPCPCRRDRRDLRGRRSLRGGRVGSTPPPIPPNPPPRREIPSASRGATTTSSGRGFTCSSASFRSRRRAQIPSEMVAVRDWGDESSRRRFGNGYGSASRGPGALARDARGASRVGHPRAAIARAATSRTSPRFDRTRSYTRFGSSRTSTRRWNGSRGIPPGNRSSRRWARWREGTSRESTRRGSRARVVRRAEALDALANVAGSNPNPEPIDAAVAFAASVSVEARERARAAAATRCVDWCSVSSRSSITRSCRNSATRARRR